MMRVKEKATGKTFLYYPDDGSGVSICENTGHCGMYGNRWKEWNDRGELIVDRLLSPFVKWVE